jgi:Sec-independent protein secretion pathway component TatC
MGEEFTVTAAGVRNPISGRWHAIWLFPLVWVACWLGNAQLLSWWCEIARRVEAVQLHAHVLRLPAPNLPTEIFATYLELCSVLALIAVVPLLTRTLAFWRRAAPSGFVACSYGMVALALLLSHLVVLPVFLQSIKSLLHAVGHPINWSVRGYLRFSDEVVLLEVGVAQLAVVLASRTREQSWSSRTLRLALLGFASFVLTAIFSPPDPLAQWTVWLTFVALFGIARGVVGFASAGKANDKPSTSATEPPP